MMMRFLFYEIFEFGFIGNYVHVHVLSPMIKMAISMNMSAHKLQYTIIPLPF
jgi:hypothetical protein